MKKKSWHTVSKGVRVDEIESILNQLNSRGVNPHEIKIAPMNNLPFFGVFYYSYAPFGGLS